MSTAVKRVKGHGIECIQSPVEKAAWRPVFDHYNAGIVLRVLFFRHLVCDAQAFLFTELVNSRIVNYQEVAIC